MTPEHRLVEAADVLLAARDREPQRMVPVDERARDVVRVDLVALVVEVLEDLLEDDAALDVDVEERRLREHLAEERAGLVERLRRKREREDAVVDLRRREEQPAEPLEREVHRVRARHAARAPVNHVLEEVADAVVLARLEPRADARPERDVRAVKLGLRGDDHPQAVGQGASCVALVLILVFARARGSPVDLRFLHERRSRS